VIYVIAAYSITVGTLVLYGALLQHRARMLAFDRAGATSPSTSDPRRGFNLGAALLAPLWMLGHGLRVPGSILALLWIAMIPLYARGLWIPLWMVASIVVAAGAALGMVGNRIVVERGGVEDLRDRSARQWPWTAAGIVLYAFVLPWLWYFVVASA
jgi:ABC-type nickel/cobalt efflux system permease component RcnA